MNALEPPQSEPDPVPLLLQKRVLLLVVVAFAALAGLYLAVSAVFDLSLTVDAHGFRDWVDGFGPWGPLLFIAVMALAVLIAPVPNLPILIAAGLAWGPWLGTGYALTGLIVGSALAFEISRLIGRRHLARLVGKNAAERIDRAADSFGGALVFWARLLPATNFDWISFAAGLTSIRFWTFCVYSSMGMALPTLLTVAAGDSLGRDIRITFALIGVWVLGVVLSAAYFWRRRRLNR